MPKETWAALIGTGNPENGDYLAGVTQEEIDFCFMVQKLSDCAFQVLYKRATEELQFSGWKREAAEAECLRRQACGSQNRH
jgi:hypothetical protein